MRRLTSPLNLSILLTLLFLGLAGFNPPAAAQTVTWTAQYYNNPPYNFTGSAVVGTSQQLVFSWLAANPGGGSPVLGINPDNWTARFTATPTFNAGVYRFVLRADRSARLYLNAGQSNEALLINLDGVAAGTTLSVDATLSGGAIPLRVEYYEDTGDASLALTWSQIVQPTATPTLVGGAAPTATPIGSTGTGTGATVSGGGTTTTNAWTATYYANTTLSGSPVLTQTVASPTFNVGTGSPGAGVPADFYSARFTATENLSAGVYRFEVSADDGVRVTVNGVRVIDHWYITDATQTYTANVAVSGAAPVTIEYFENTLGSALFYSVTRAADGTPTSTSFAASDPRQAPPAIQQPTFPIFATARIIAGRLNIREQPSLSARVITKVNFGEYYNVVGANADRSWYQLQIGNSTGWGVATFLDISSLSTVPQTAPTNAQSAVPNPYANPSVNPFQPPPLAAPAPTGYTLVTTANVIIRNQPSASASRGGIIPAGASAPILGRNSSSTWWYTSYNFQDGWISGAYALVAPGMDLNAIPVVGQ